MADTVASLNKKLKDAFSKAESFRRANDEANETKWRAEVARLKNAKAVLENKAKTDTAKKDIETYNKRIADLQKKAAANVPGAKIDLAAAKKKLTDSEKKLADALAAKKTLIPTRPIGVPEGAKFNSPTGQWTLGSESWDKAGKKVVVKSTKPPVVSTKPPVVTDTTVTDTTVTDTAAAGATPATGTVNTTTIEGINAASGFPASTTASTTATDTATTATDFGKVFADAQKRYGVIDEIFKTNTELRDLLEKAMGKVGDPNDDFTLKQFTDLVENTKWFKANAGPIQKRGFYKRQYEFLAQDLKESDPEYQKKLAELDKTSEYGRGLAEVIQDLQEEAIEQGKELDDTTARALAIEIYDYANEKDTVKIRKAVTGAGKFGTATVGGTAGTALQTLRRVAKSNGFDLDVDFADQKDTWLNAILNGESVEKFSSLIRQRAGQGQNKFVQGLLKDGINLDGVYGPYIELMSQYFDIPAGSIKINDPLLAKVFTDAGGIKYADFETILRTDPRFKGTKQAGQAADIRQSIANRALALGVTLAEDQIDDVVNNALSMGLSANSSLVDGLIRAKFTYVPGKTTLGGAAGGALAQLKATAAANGIDFDTQFGTQAQTWLSKILQGESPETFKNVIRQVAKTGYQNVPQVSSLLDLGVDLETIYSPYKNVMASVLEVNPQTITLNDKTLRSAIGSDKEMTLYDWERFLRKDPRWQYTNNARQEVSSIGLNVLQQLGFQG